MLLFIQWQNICVDVCVSYCYSFIICIEAMKFTSTCFSSFLFRFLFHYTSHLYVFRKYFFLFQSKTHDHDIRIKYVFTCFEMYELIVFLFFVFCFSVCYWTLNSDTIEIFHRYNLYACSFIDFKRNDSDSMDV